MSKNILFKKNRNIGITIFLIVFITMTMITGCGNSKKNESNINKDKTIITNFTDLQGELYQYEVGDFSPLYMYENNVYIAFTSHIDGQGYSPNVMRYNGSSWELIGNFDFEKNPLENISFFVDKGTLYIAYSAYDPKYEDCVMKVMKYTGSSWETIGQAWTTNALNPSLYVYDGIPYIIEDDYKVGELKVSKFSENRWEKVGNKNVSSNKCGIYSLVVDKGIPYVAYSMYTNSKEKESKIVVKRFDGSDWEQIGSDIYNGQMFFYDVPLVIEDNIPYIAYVKKSNVSGKINRKAIVMKYNDHNWEEIGRLDNTVDPQGVALDVQNGIPYLAYEYDGGELVQPQLALVRFENGKAEILIEGIKQDGEKRSASNVEVYIDNEEIYIAYKNEYPYEKHPEKEFDMHGEELMIKKISN